MAIACAGNSPLIALAEPGHHERGNLSIVALPAQAVDLLDIAFATRASNLPIVALAARGHHECGDMPAVALAVCGHCKHGNSPVLINAARPNYFPDVTLTARADNTPVVALATRAGNLPNVAPTVSAGDSPTITFAVCGKCHKASHICLPPMFQIPEDGCLLGATKPCLSSVWVVMCCPMMWDE